VSERDTKKGEGMWARCEYWRQAVTCSGDWDRLECSHVDDMKNDVGNRKEQGERNSKSENAWLLCVEKQKAAKTTR